VLLRVVRFESVQRSAGALAFMGIRHSGRLPRAAIALTPARILAVAVDGRGPEDAGLTLRELARVLVRLGAETALNLDGGSSAALVAGGARRNTPRDDHGRELTPGEPVPTAVLLTSGP
jgi:exopolysaccharide biosynthesis protein